MKAYILKNLHDFPYAEEKQPPVPHNDKVVLKLTASALNHRDIWITKGLYPGIRLGATMGADGCGSDESGAEYIINPGLDWGGNEAFQSPNFRVLGVPDDGTFAEYIGIDKTYLYPKPGHLTSVEAAALPLAGVTAYRALIKRAHTKEGDKVLISGIGGGVALMAMQFALALGCEVFVTSASESKISRAIDMGAKAGYLYTDPEWSANFLKENGGGDVIVDSAGGAGFQHLIKICNPGARIVFYGGTHGKIENLNPQPLFWKQISLLGSTMGSDHDFAEMVNFVTTCQITPVVDKVFSLNEIHLGFNHMMTGNQFGKIVFRH